MSDFQNHIGDDLLILIKANDQFAFAAFCDLYRPLLFISAYKRLNNEEEAKDIVQEICIWIWEHRNSIDITSGVKAYLRGAVRNKTSDLIRQKMIRRQKEQQYADNRQRSVNIIPILERKELSTSISLAIDLIPPASRQAFILSYLEHKSLREISVEMEINVQTVKNHIHRALKLLRKNLQKK